METIYKMTREDKRLLKGHTGRMVLHMTAEDWYTSVHRFNTLHMTRVTEVPRKDGMVADGPCRVVYEIDGCGDFECLSDAVFVLKTTGRLHSP